MIWVLIMFDFDFILVINNFFSVASVLLELAAFVKLKMNEDVGLVS
jgi:hypothetical protein